jgi:hypothetical protein
MTGLDEKSLAELEALSADSVGRLPGPRNSLVLSRFNWRMLSGK